MTAFIIGYALGAAMGTVLFFVAEANQRREREEYEAMIRGMFRCEFGESGRCQWREMNKKL